MATKEAQEDSPDAPQPLTKLTSVAEHEAAVTRHVVSTRFGPVVVHVQGEL